MSQPIVLVALLVATCALAHVWTRRKDPLPPGPKRWPLIGSMLSIPKKEMAKGFKEWSNTYDSDILYVSAPGQSLLIVNRLDIALDLLDKRSAQYSSRPSTVMGGDLSGVEAWSMGQLRYGDEWRVRRKIAHNTLHEGRMKTFHPLIRASVVELLDLLLSRPDEFAHHVHYAGAKSTITITYGPLVNSENDPWLKKIMRVSETVNEVLAPGQLVEAIPILKYLPTWFPGAKFKRLAFLLKEQCEKTGSELFEASKALIASGTSQPSMVSIQLDDIKETSADRRREEQIIVDTALVMYSAGADTTSATVTAFILAMVLNPHVLQRAQEELDRVLGEGDLPTFDDRDKLPYVNALVHETMRWASVTPHGVPHLTESEDFYQGYYIPKNTTVIANAWGMLNDSNVYPNPDRYDPERFLTKDGRLSIGENDPKKITFGFGRRICPGRHFAFDSIFMSIASILTVFDIHGVKGSEINPLCLFDEEALVRHPLPFKCSIVPRSPKAVNTILSARSGIA